MTLIKMMEQAVRFLKAEGMTVSKRDVRQVMKDTLQIDETDFIITPDRLLTEDQTERLWDIWRRMGQGEPPSRILGAREFWGLTFKVTPATLDPRPDTETLVEAVLNTINFHKIEGLKILDLGTGTGCIPIALLHELPHAQAYAVDYSFDAAKVALENARLNSVADRFHIIQGDWMAALKPRSFDIITSNPPYIKSSDIQTLMPQVKNHDPHPALSGGESGLECYQKIISSLKKYLNPQGRIFLEIGIGQCDDVMRLVGDSMLYDVQCVADLCGVPRVVTARCGDK